MVFEFIAFWTMFKKRLGSIWCLFVSGLCSPLDRTLWRGLDKMLLQSKLAVSRCGAHTPVCNYGTTSGGTALGVFWIVGLSGRMANVEVLVVDIWVAE